MGEIIMILRNNDKKIVGITTIGTYYSPWFKYTIASIYNHVDEIVVVNGGYNLSNPEKGIFNIPLKRATDDIKHLDINNKIFEITAPTLDEINHKAEVTTQFDANRRKKDEGWWDVRGVNMTLAQEIAFELGADWILKIDSDQVCYPDIKQIKQVKKGLIFYQYEFVHDIMHLADPGPHSPYNDSVFIYESKKEGFYHGGGSPAVFADREFTDKIHCAHLRYANPKWLTDEEKMAHFFGRAWWFKFTGEGLWGHELTMMAHNTAKNTFTMDKRLSDPPPPEVCLYKDPKKYIEEKL